MTIELKQLVIPEGFKAYWAQDLAEDDYHADRTSLSSSLLRRAYKSMRAFKEHFDGRAKVETPAMRFGTMVHKIILEGADKFWKQYVVEPEFIGYTKDGRPSARSGEARDKRAAWYSDLAPGVKVVTEEQLDKLRGMIESLMAHEQAMTLLKNGQPEVSGFYRDPDTGIKCRVRYDFWNPSLSTLVDLKTTSDCTEWEFMRKVFKPSYRYDIQLAMYEQAMQQIDGAMPDHLVWVTIEPEAPHEVAVHEAGPMTVAIGRYEYRRLMNSVKLAIDNNRWPGYQSVVGVAEPPNWIVNDYTLKGIL